MRTRSRARSPLRARVWPDELPLPGFAAPNQRFDGPPANPLALMRAKRVAVEEVFAPYHVITAQIDDPEVRIVANGYVTFVSQSRATRDVGGGHARHFWQG